jgi:hypothetical protein
MCVHITQILLMVNHIKQNKKCFEHFNQELYLQSLLLIDSYTFDYFIPPILLSFLII